MSERDDALKALERYIDIAYGEGQGTEREDAILRAAIDRAYPPEEDEESRSARWSKDRPTLSGYYAVRLAPLPGDDAGDDIPIIADLFIGANGPWCQGLDIEKILYWWTERIELPSPSAGVRFTGGDAP